MSRLLCVVVFAALVVAGCANKGAGGRVGNQPIAPAPPAPTAPSLQAVPLAVDPPDVNSFEACKDPTGDVVVRWNLHASGGSPHPHYTWGLASGSSFPAGITADPFSGLVKSNGGSLADPGTYTAVMEVSDGQNKADGEVQFNVNDGAQRCLAAFEVYGEPLRDAVSAHDYGTTLGYGLAAETDSRTVRWSTSDNLHGLTLDATTGVLYGAPFSSAEGTTISFTVRVIDGAGNVAACQPTCAFTLNIK